MIELLHKWLKLLFNITEADFLWTWTTDLLKYKKFQTHIMTNFKLIFRKWYSSLWHFLKYLFIPLHLALCRFDVLDSQEHNTEHQMNSQKSQCSGQLFCTFCLVTLNKWQTI